MNKKALENFLQKYNLGGQVESVRWISDGIKLTTNFASGDQNVVGFLETDQVKIEAGEYDIFNTNELRSLLAILGDDIEIEVVRDKKNEPFAFLLKDERTKVNFILAEPTAVTKVPKINKLPAFNVVFPLDQKFVTTFVKSAGALRENGETFVITSNGSKAQLTIGHSDSMHQTNVVIDLDATTNDELKSAKFDTICFKDVLQVNKEMKEATMSVSEYNIAEINMTVEGFSVKYYLCKVNKG